MAFYPLKDTILKLMSRITSRVFLGELLCRNEEWLEITRDYSVDSFAAAEELRFWPAIVCPIVHSFLPRCRELRALVAKARRTLQPVLDERRCLRSESLNAVDDDASEWFEKAAKGRHYDPVSAQLILSLAAIHTTTDLTCQTLIQLAQNPEILVPLRKEIVDGFQEHGWTKSSLYNMKLLDSVMKESQRLKPNLSQQDLSILPGATGNMPALDGFLLQMKLKSR